VEDQSVEGALWLHPRMDANYLQAENPPHCRVHFGDPTRLWVEAKAFRASPKAVFWDLVL